MSFKLNFVWCPKYTGRAIRYASVNYFMSILQFLVFGGRCWTFCRLCMPWTFVLLTIDTAGNTHTHTFSFYLVFNLTLNEEEETRKKDFIYWHAAVCVGLCVAVWCGCGYLSFFKTSCWSKFDGISVVIVDPVLRYSCVYSCLWPPFPPNYLLCPFAILSPFV